MKKSSAPKFYENENWWLQIITAANKDSNRIDEYMPRTWGIIIGDKPVTNRPTIYQWRHEDGIVPM